MNIALREPRMSREEFFDWAEAQAVGCELDGCPGPAADSAGARDALSDRRLVARCVGGFHSPQWRIGIPGCVCRIIVIAKDEAQVPCRAQIFVLPMLVAAIGARPQKLPAPDRLETNVLAPVLTSRV